MTSGFVSAIRLRAPEKDGVSFDTAWAGFVKPVSHYVVGV
jgi:hypothetical protein